MNTTASPDTRSPSYEACLLIIQSVCAALDRAGVDDCDDPGEAIDVMREGYERRLAAPQVEMVSDEMVGDAIDAFNAEAVTGEEFLLSKRAGVRMKAALQAALNARAGGDAKDAERWRAARALAWQQDEIEASEFDEEGDAYIAALASQAVGVKDE